MAKQLHLGESMTIHSLSIILQSTNRTSATQWNCICYLHLVPHSRKNTAQNPRGQIILKFDEHRMVLQHTGTQVFHTNLARTDGNRGCRESTLAGRHLRMTSPPRYTSQPRHSAQALLFRPPDLMPAHPVMPAPGGQRPHYRYRGGRRLCMHAMATSCTYRTKKSIHTKTPASHIKGASPSVDQGDTLGSARSARSHPPGRPGLPSCARGTTASNTSPCYFFAGAGAAPVSPVGAAEPWHRSVTATASGRCGAAGVAEAPRGLAGGCSQAPASTPSRIPTASLTSDVSSSTGRVHVFPPIRLFT